MGAVCTARAPYDAVRELAGWAKAHWPEVRGRLILAGHDEAGVRALSGPAVLDVAYTLLAEQSDWTDRVALMAGAPEPPQARMHLDEQLAEGPEINEEAETNVVELSAWIEQVNRAMS